MIVECEELLILSATMLMSGSYTAHGKVVVTWRISDLSGRSRMPQLQGWFLLISCRCEVQMDVIIPWVYLLDGKIKLKFDMDAAFTLLRRRFPSKGSRDYCFMGIFPAFPLKSFKLSWDPRHDKIPMN